MLEAIQLNFEKEKEIEERIKVEATLQHLSRQDGLTGFFNRRHFDESLLLELRRVQRESSELSLAMLDIDSFKLYNDTYGHQQGDDCLKTVSKLIQKAVQRSGDLAARFGGEEFALILPNTKVESAYRIVESIRESIIAQNIPHKSTEVNDLSRVSISAGIATLKPDSHTTASDVIEPADSSLYQAKADGRNRIVSHS